MREWREEIESKDPEYFNHHYEYYWGYFDELFPLSIDESFFNLWKLASEERNPVILVKVRVALLS
jgi:hypothetical protein